MAIQSNFPAIKPSLLLDFANTKSLDPRITFTRASTATYYDGVTTAMAEQNFLTYSQEFDNASWGKSAITVTANFTTAPDGTSTADLIDDGTAANNHYLYKTVSDFTKASTNYTANCYVKQPATNSRRYFNISVYRGGAAYAAAIFDLDNPASITTAAAGAGYAVVSSSCTETYAGSGWFRCVLTVTGGTDVVDTVAFGAASSTTIGSYGLASSYTGSNKQLLIWGAQLEQRSAVSAYTATTTQAITNYIPVLKTAASGVARFDNNPTTGESLGLLIEEQRTNLNTYSSQFDNAAYTKINSATITTAANIAPDGTQTAQLFTVGATNARIQSDITVTTSTAYTATIYAKAGNASYLCFGFASNPASSAIFNLSTGVVSNTVGSPTSTSITSVGNGWYRCSITVTSTSTSLRIIIGASSTNTFSSTNYPNGTVGDTGFIWGAQLEAGAFATSYIPTVASQVTRSADAASMTGTNFSSWYNQGAGTIFVDYVGNSSNAAANNQGIYHFGPGGYAGTNSNIAIINLNGMTTAINLTGTLSSLNATPRAVTGRLATSYSPTTLSSVVNNNTVATTTIGPALGGITSVNFGTTPSPIPSMNGSIKKFAFYPIAVTSAQLQALTS